MRFRAAEVASLVGGRLTGDDIEVDGVATDSRGDVRGRLFVPLVAERDGHAFIDAAVANGAAAYLTSREPTHSASDVPAIVVSDTLAALTSIGRAARDRLPDRVVGVTGSVGKTSVKDLLAATLATTYETAASERSFNNEIGVPLTLANAGDDVTAAVVEMAHGASATSPSCAPSPDRRWAS